MATAPNMGTSAHKRLESLRQILEHLRAETYLKVREFRRDQEQELEPPPADEVDAARSTADIETHASLIERAEDRLRAIDQALGRVTRGVYGICAECGDDIPIERLRALPFAALCVDCQSKRGSARRSGMGTMAEPYSHQWSPPREMASIDEGRGFRISMAEDMASGSIADSFAPEDDGGSNVGEPRRKRGRPRKNPIK